VSDLTEALEDWVNFWRLDVESPAPDFGVILDAARKWAALDTQETREAIAQVLYERFYDHEEGDRFDSGSSPNFVTDHLADTDAVLAVLKDS
jgi:hypothetical protein